MSRLLAGVLVAFAVGRGDAQDRPFWEQRGCELGYTFEQAKRGVRTVMYGTARLTRRRGARAWRFARCVATRGRALRLGAAVRRGRAWRRSYDGRWVLAWRRLPAAGQSWTRRVSWLESRHGTDPDTNRNGYLGVFQWKLATWRAACSCAISPVVASWHHEATVAWRWHLSHPTGQWPNTGE